MHAAAPTSSPAPPSTFSTRACVLTLAGAVAPPLLLALVGTSHPTVLTPETAGWWRDLHILGLIGFPLLALPPWLVVRGRGRWIEITVIVLGVVYAAFYTALDAIAGIGGGHATMAVGPGPWVSSLFGIADAVVVPGVYAHLAAAGLAAAVVVATTRGLGRIVAAVGGVLVVGAAYEFILSHIFYPYGVAVMVVLALGWLLVALAATGLVGGSRARAA